MKISLLLALLFTMAACDKQPATDAGGSPTAPAQAVPFKGEVYQTLNQRKTITLVSADELEHHNGDFNLVCKYTKQGDTLRLVENVMGTTQAVYFKITPQGLRGNDGTILYSPSGRRKAIEEIQLAKQRQEEERREIQAEIVRSRVQNREIRSFELKPSEPGGYYLQHLYTPSRINVTDVSVRLDFPDKEPSETVYFSDITHFDYFENIMGVTFKSLLIIKWIYKDGVNVEFKLGTATEPQAGVIRQAVSQAYKAWKEKFPRAGRHTK